MLEIKGFFDGGVLKGDLIVCFGGDLMFKWQDICNMVVMLKKVGVQCIEGNVFIDILVFVSYDKVFGWLWNDLMQCFSVLLVVVIVDCNCFFVLLYSVQKLGDVVFICVVFYYLVIMFSQV